MKKNNGAIIILALAFIVTLLLSLYNGNFNWKIDLLGPIVFFIILYGAISYEKKKNKK